MICTWCNEEYDVSSIYHICDDGTTYEMRRSKSQADFDEHRMTREMRRTRLTKSIDYDTIKWTGSDLNMLKKAHIQP